MKIYRFLIVFVNVVLALEPSFANERKAEEFFNKYQKPSYIRYPKTNPHSLAKEELGKKLFFDPRLSGSNWISCATCHNPALTWGDGLAKGIGHGMKDLSRRTPTILNLAWGSLMFWDGRSSSLENQALFPIATPGEMNLPIHKMLEKLKSIGPYNDLFTSVFGKSGITPENVGKAIATYERTIVSADAPFDKWVKGDKKAISPEAERGFLVFNGKGRCGECHAAWRFTDDNFHDIGIKTEDRGRGAILNTPTLDFTFKTPTLRNIDRRSPYMHNGSEKSLEDVIDLYNRGGRVRRKTISDNIVELNLSDTEKSDLISFLKTLTSDDKDVILPVLPQS